MNSHQGYWEAFKSNFPDYTCFGYSIRGFCYFSAMKCCCVCNNIEKNGAIYTENLQVIEDTDVMLINTHQIKTQDRKCKPKPSS